jgi:hypothetical protein
VSAGQLPLGALIRSSTLQCMPAHAAFASLHKPRVPRRAQVPRLGLDWMADSLRFCGTGDVLVTDSLAGRGPLSWLGSWVGWNSS